MELSIDWAYQLLKQEEVPAHIIRHSERVALVSLFLGCSLVKKGNNLDLKVLTLAALLHDVKKFSSLKTGENHALAGYNLMKGLGLERMGEIIYAHIYLKAPKPGSPISEEEIVFYADKRVMHDRIVPLRERFRDLETRYGRTLKAIIRMRLLEEMTLILERRLFKNLDITPESFLKLNDIKEVRGVLEKKLEGCSDSWGSFL